MVFLHFVLDFNYRKWIWKLIVSHEIRIQAVVYKNKRVAMLLHQDFSSLQAHAVVGVILPDMVWIVLDHHCCIPLPDGVDFAHDELGAQIGLNG